MFTSVGGGIFPFLHLYISGKLPGSLRVAVSEVSVDFIPDGSGAKKGVWYS